MTEATIDKAQVQLQIRRDTLDHICKMTDKQLGGYMDELCIQVGKTPDDEDLKYKAQYCAVVLKRRQTR